MIEIRGFVKGDFVFLQEMAVYAMWWQPASEPPSVARALTEPEFAKLLDGWGRAGDRAVVAAPAGVSLGLPGFASGMLISILTASLTRGPPNSVSRWFLLAGGRESVERFFGVSWISPARRATVR